MQSVGNGGVREYGGTGVRKPLKRLERNFNKLMGKYGRKYRDRMELKTNAMRLLDAAKIDYIPHSLGVSDAVTAVEAAGMLGADPARVFKTLVTQGRSGGYFVFVIPTAAELDLKKAAAAAG